MKRLFYLTVCVAVLALSGCANGLTSCGSNTCNQGGLFSGGLFSGNGPFADGPVRQWLRGDECDTCNAPAGQPLCDSNTAATCSSCGQAAPMNDVYAQPAMGGQMINQPMINQPMMNQPMMNQPITGQPGFDAYSQPVQNGTVNSFYPDYGGQSMDGGLGGSSNIVPGNDVYGSGNVESVIDPPFNSSFNLN